VAALVAFNLVKVNVLNSVPLWLKWPEFFIPVGSPVQVTPLFCTILNSV